MCFNTTSSLVVVTPTQGYVDFNTALVVLYVLYVCVTIAAWWWLHKGRPHLEKRSFPLMAFAGVSGIIQFILSPTRESIGAESFSCDAYLWLSLMLIIFVIGPYTLQLAIFKFKADFNREIGSLDNAMLVSVFKNVNIQEINQRRRTTVVPPTFSALTRKRQSQAATRVDSSLSTSAIEDLQQSTNAESIIAAKHHASDRNAARMVLIRMIFPALAIGIILTAVNLDGVYGDGCTGCSTSDVEDAVIGLEVVYMVANGAYYGYQTRTMPDPWGILRGTRNVLIFGFIVGIIGFGLVVLDPMSLYATKQFDWGWIMCAAIAGMHTMACVVPLWHSKHQLGLTAITRDEFKQKLQIVEFHQAFREFSVGLFVIENITCWDFCQVLLRGANLDMTLKTMLSAAFIIDTAPMQVNISDTVREEYNQLCEGQDEASWHKALELVSADLLKLMHSDTLPRFIKTEKGREVMGEVV